MKVYENVLESILDVPKQRVAFVSKSGSLSYGDICEIYHNNLTVISQLHGSCVCIRKQSRFDFALILSILDGSVKRIVFMPEDIDDDLLADYYRQSEVDFEVSIVDSELVFHSVESPSLDVVSTVAETATEWIVPTSGTTKIPKLVSHTFLSLSRSTVRDIDKGFEYIWGLTFDIYRFSGIQVFLQSILGGSSLIIPSSEDSIQETLQLFGVNSCNVISATPSFWRKAFMVKEINNLELKRVTLGGEIVDEHILTVIKNRFRGVKVTHIYASTEVGVGFAVTDGKAGFPKSYLEQGLKNNINLSVRDGILWINPGIQAQKYLAQDSEMFDADGFINTGDVVQEEEDRFIFLGRESGAINVGGNKVQPEEVEQVLLGSGLIDAAFVFAKNNPMMGSLVCADVIAKKSILDEKKMKLELLNYCKENLEAFKRPVILRVVQELTISKSGKLKRF